MIRQILRTYVLTGKEPNLAVKDEGNQADLLKKLGFKKQKEFWVIDMAGAREALKMLSLERHWESESDRRFGLDAA